MSDALQGRTSVVASSSAAAGVACPGGRARPRRLSPMLLERKRSKKQSKAPDTNEVIMPVPPAQTAE